MSTACNPDPAIGLYERCLQCWPESYAFYMTPGRVYDRLWASIIAAAQRQIRRRSIAAVSYLGEVELPASMRLQSEGFWAGDVVWAAQTALMHKVNSLLRGHHLPQARAGHYLHHPQLIRLTSRLQGLCGRIYVSLWILSPPRSPNWPQPAALTTHRVTVKASGLVWKGFVVWWYICQYEHKDIIACLSRMHCVFLSTHACV